MGADILEELLERAAEPVGGLVAEAGERGELLLQHRRAGALGGGVADEVLGLEAAFLDHLGRGLDLGEEREELDCAGLLEDGAVLSLHLEVVEAEGEELLRELAVRQDVLDLLLALDLVERRLREIDVALLDELGHLAVEEREEQRPDVRAVDIGIGHDHDLVVARLRDVPLLAEAAPDRRD